MAKIKTYRCARNQCRYIIYTAEGYPVWHAETPTHLKKLPVPPASEEYVIGLRSELFCRYCKKIVDPGEELVCPRCERGGINTNEGGRSCPQCIVGTLSLVHYSIL